MIWLIIALAPVVLAVLWGCIVSDVFFKIFIAWIGACALVTGWLLLFCYGGWEMGWFTHCGNFWESYHCGG